MCKNLAITGCNIINSDPNGAIMEDMTILVNEKGIIREIGRVGSTSVPANYQRLEANGKYVMPGLINAHSHLFGSGKPINFIQSEKITNLIFFLAKTGIGKKIVYKVMLKNAITALHSGVTTIRCVGDFFYMDVKIRDNIQMGKIDGPRLCVSGPLISVTGGHGAPYLALVSDSPWEARKRVRENLKKGVDLIKICVTGGVTDAKKVGEAGQLQMTREEVIAVCEEAHKVGLMVAAHAESTEGVRIALQGGVDTIEHGAEMDEEIITLFKDNPRSLRGYSALIPTFHAAIPVYKLDKELTMVNEIVWKNSAIVYENMLKGFKQAIKNNIKIGFGTDASMAYVPHYSTWREMDYLIRFGGITESQAIYLATVSNAEIMGIDNITGSIDIGKYADLLILNQNPLDDIKVLSNPYLVVSKGNTIVPHIKKDAKLDSLLDSIK